MATVRSFRLYFRLIAFLSIAIAKIACGALVVLASCLVNALPFLGEETAEAATKPTAVREFEINGTKLYVPLGWGIHISYEAKAGDVYLKPGESIPLDAGSPAKLDYLQTIFCHPDTVPSGKAGDPRAFELKRSYDTPELPPNWCIGRFSLSRGDRGIAQNPRLGHRSLPEEFVAKSLAPIDQNGFRVLRLNPQTKEGGYYGFREDDVSRAGGAITISCGRSLGQSGYFECSMTSLGTSGLAIDGIRPHAFEWIVSKIAPEELRNLFWQGQAFLDWLATPPDQRSSLVKAP